MCISEGAPPRTPRMDPYHDVMGTPGHMPEHQLCSGLTLKALIEGRYTQYLQHSHAISG